MITDCLPRAWAKNDVTMKATRLKCAASTQLAMKEETKLEVQLEQRIAEVGFLVVNNLTTDMILGTA